MLEELIELVAQGGIWSFDDLTRALSISRPMLEVILEDLGRRGYLRAVDEGCGGHCQGCAVGGCSIAGPGHLWALTEKGAQAAARLDATAAAG